MCNWLVEINCVVAQNSPDFYTYLSYYYTNTKEFTYIGATCTDVELYEQTECTYSI